MQGIEICEIRESPPGRKYDEIKVGVPEITILNPKHKNM
jgi:hypothetical protein